MLCRCTTSDHTLLCMIANLIILLLMAKFGVVLSFGVRMHWVRSYKHDRVLHICVELCLMTSSVSHNVVVYICLSEMFNHSSFTNNKLH